MPHPSLLPAALILVGTALPALADMTVSFREGAPKDEFRFENVGACPITDTTLVLDLGGSAAGLIFDVTAEGAGVEVYQPFEVTLGAAALAALPAISDGQSLMRLEITKLDPGKVVAFTIDVDDTLGPRGITVSGAEIAGASVSLVKDGLEESGAFSSAAQAEILLPTCRPAA